MNTLFIEKYRPKVKEDVVGNKKELDRLFSIVEGGNIPHCLFEGVPGVGKTTTALVIARQLFGEYYKTNWQEFNASDDRGIDVVRGDIKTFCKTAPLGSSFKILFLDESDGLTSAAQESLRRLMETYSSVTRFILSCNDVSKIIEPIQSRCELFHFSPLSDQDIASRVKIVSSQEKILIDEEAISLLAERSEGDMRKALNKLQVLSSYGKPITKQDLIKYEKTHDSFGTIIKSLQTGRFLESRKIVQEFLLEGYTERDIVQGLHKSFISQADLLPQVKGECILTLADIDYKMTQGVSKSLQLDACLLKMLKVLKLP